MTDADRLPTGPVLRRFWPTIVHRDLKPENILPGQYAFEAFLAVRGRLGGASFCELECEIIPGAVREVVSVAKVQRKPRSKRAEARA